MIGMKERKEGKVEERINGRIKGKGEEEERREGKCKERRNEGMEGNEDRERG